MTKMHDDCRLAFRLALLRAGSAAGIQVAVAGVMRCDPDDKNIR